MHIIVQKYGFGKGRETAFPANSDDFTVNAA